MKKKPSPKTKSAASKATPQGQSALKLSQVMSEDLEKPGKRHKQPPVAQDDDIIMPPVIW